MAGVLTGTSVLGIAFEGGVLIAADTLVSYGSMARFKDKDRIMAVNNKTVVAASGDYADFQFIRGLIEEMQIDEEEWNDSIELKPKGLHSWITRVAYNRRSKFQPIYCSWVVGGLQPIDKNSGKYEPFLGFVDKLGTSYKSNVICSGFGSYLATPLFRELTEAKDKLPTEAEARKLVEEAMKLLYHRDARSLPRYKLAVVKAEGLSIEGPIEVKGEWQIAHLVKGY